MTAKRKRAPGRPAARSPARSPAPVDLEQQEVPVPEPTGREIVQEPPPPYVGDEVGELLARLGAGGGQMHVSRRTETGKWAYVATLSSDGFSAQLVQQRFGGGTYRVTARHARTHQVACTRTFEVADVPQATAAGGDLSLIRELLAELRTARQPAQQDPMTLAVQMQQVAATQMTTLVGLLEALRGKEAPAAPALESQVSILRDLLELAPKLLRNGPREDSALDRFLPGIFDLLRGMQQPRAAVPGAPPAPGPALPPAEGSAPVNPIWRQLAPHVPQLIALARTHADQALWADVIQEQAPAAVRAIAAMQRTPDDLADEFCAVFQDAVPYRDWFVGLLAELLAPAEEDPSQTGG